MSEPVIAMSGVGMTYAGPPPVHALREVTAEIRSGDYVAVIGPSGAGKSTFLNIVGLLDVPTKGRFYFDGIDTATLTEDQRTGLRGARIGFVFQSFHLMNHRTATENVALAMLYNRTDPHVRTERARTALASVGLTPRRDALPSTLSGGERQRVAIARALVTEPAVLLCDEPTGNLDSSTAAGILTLLDDLHRDGLTIVVITHDAQVAAHGGRTFHISDGALTEVEP